MYRKLILLLHHLISLLTIIITTTIITTTILALLQVPYTAQAAWKALTLWHFLKGTCDKESYTA